MSDDGIISQHCMWSDCEKFCDTIQSASIPLDDKWPYLILYLRGLKNDHFLSEIQKADMQDLLIKVMQSKDFSEESYLDAVQKIHAVFTAPYRNKIDAVVRQAAALTVEVCGILGKQKDQVISVAERVEAELANGVLPEDIIARLRIELKNVVAKMEEDTVALSELSYKDALTGLANRRSFDTILEKAVVSWLEHGEQAALVMFDVDRFKIFNDTYGHLIGDQVLKTFASELLKFSQHYAATLDSDIVASRYGGEEFALLLSGSLHEKAEEIAEKLRIRIGNSKLRLRDTEGAIVQGGIQVTVSAGISRFYKEWKSAHALNLIDFADKALYMAKNNGRNLVYMYTPYKKFVYSRVSPE